MFFLSFAPPALAGRLWAGPNGGSPSLSPFFSRRFLALTDTGPAEKWTCTYSRTRELVGGFCRNRTFSLEKTCRLRAVAVSCRHQKETQGSRTCTPGTPEKIAAVPRRFLLSYAGAIFDRKLVVQSNQTVAKWRRQIPGVCPCIRRGPLLMLGQAPGMRAF